MNSIKMITDISKEKAIFPGSFNPITVGHISIIKRALPLFDKVYVGIAVNPEKKYEFTVADRYEWCKEACRIAFPEEYADKIEVVSYDYLTANFCKDYDINYIIRGIRGGADFEYENMLYHANKTVNKDLETIYFITEHQYIGVSSSIVREIYKNNGDVSALIPEGVNIYKRKD